MKRQTFFKALAFMLSFAVIFAFAGCGESRISAIGNNGSDPGGGAEEAISPQTHVAFIESSFPIYNYQLGYAVEALIIIADDIGDNLYKESVPIQGQLEIAVIKWLSIGMDHAWFFINDSAILNFNFDILHNSGVIVNIVSGSYNPEAITETVTENYPFVNMINIDRNYLANEIAMNFNGLGSSDKVYLIGFDNEEMRQTENELLDLGMDVHALYMYSGNVYMDLLNLIYDDILYYQCNVIVMNEWLGEMLDDILQQIGYNFFDYFGFSFCQIIEPSTAAPYRGIDSYAFLFDLDDYRDQIRNIGHDIIGNDLEGMVYYTTPAFLFF